MCDEEQHGKLRDFAGLEEPKPASSAVDLCAEDEHGDEEDERDGIDGRGQPIEQLAVVEQGAGEIDRKTEDGRVGVRDPDRLERG